MTAAYPELEARFGRLGAVEEAIAVLHWDAAAMMPAGGTAARAEQIATLRVMAHELLSAPEISDLLSAWGDGLKGLIGIDPGSDREGVLQDIHWYDGAWGYFPTYTLGALIAAQLFAAARAALPDMPAAIGRGEFGPLLGWLRHKIHARGSLLSTAELVESATGSPLGTAAFERHLRARYLG